MKKINKICRMFFTVIISFAIMGNAVNVNASAKTNACVTHGGTFRGDIKMSVSYNAKATDIFVPYGIKYGSTIYPGYFQTNRLDHTSYCYIRKTISSKEEFSGTFDVKAGTYNSRNKTFRLSINGSILGYTAGTAKPIYLILKKGTVSKYIYTLEKPIQRNVSM